MVDDDLVPAVGTQRRLDCLRNGLAGFDVADDGSIFGVVAELVVLLVDEGLGGWRTDKEVGGMDACSW